MISFRNVVGYFETIASKHYQISSFHSGMMDEVDINKLGVLTYNFTIYVMDMINDEVGDAPNKERTGRINAYSENLEILQDVVAEFKHALYSTSWVDGEVVLQLPITAEPFTARFNNLLTGWSASISLDVNNKNNLCIAPVDPNS